MAATNKNLFSILAALAPSLLAIAWLVTKAQWFWNHRPDMAFGWIVLMLSAFVLYDQWERRPEPVFRLNAFAVLCAVFGLGTLFVVQIYQAAFGTMPALIWALSFGIFAVVASNISYVYGRPGLRFFAFPVLFLLIALPLPSALYNPIVGGLQSKVAALNVEILNLAGIPARRIGSLIQLPNGVVGVDEACSGIRSLQSTIMATLFIGYLTLKHRSMQLLLLGSGVAFAFFGNLIRSLYLSMTANAKGIQAIEKVHDSAGWSILLFTACGVALLAWLFSRLEKWVNEQALEFQSKGAMDLEKAGG